MSATPEDARERISSLRRRLGLFSFQQECPAPESTLQVDRCPSLRVRPGAIVEWLTATAGAGACASAIHVMLQSGSAHGVIAIVDAVGQCYAPALFGWGIQPAQTLFIRPTTREEACWATEQCLRCPGVSATWVWLEQRIPTHVRRRWQLAAETGGGVGIIFRPGTAQRDSVWVDLRLLVTPRPGGQGETRRVQIEVLYRRGGLGGTAQLWEIDHAEGVMRLVPEMAHPAAAEREARA